MEESLQHNLPALLPIRLVAVPSVDLPPHIFHALSIQILPQIANQIFESAGRCADQLQFHPAPVAFQVAIKRWLGIVSSHLPATRLILYNVSLFL